MPFRFEAPFVHLVVWPHERDSVGEVMGWWVADNAASPTFVDFYRLKFIVDVFGMKSLLVMVIQAWCGRGGGKAGLEHVVGVVSSLPCS